VPKAVFAEAACTPGEPLGARLLALPADDLGTHAVEALIEHNTPPLGQVREV
jgi:hypothetical protein